MFIDHIRIFAKAGDGGDGVVSWRREKYVPRGGPDGGDGGRGGHVIVRGNKNMWTLFPLKFKKHFKAEHGGDGSKQRSTGKDGKDVFIEVPMGTIIRDGETQEILFEITHENPEQILLDGGMGGLGNWNFRSSTHQTPRFAQPGIDFKEGWFQLELKVLADVGLLGMPNAGKSTFIRAVSAAKPKVADYPFTTMVPNLGVVDADSHRSFVMADIPGLIEGASEGAGLGIRFLKHLARTRILLHIVDVQPIDGSDPAYNAKAILGELEKFSPTLSKLPIVLVLNKVDQLADDTRDEWCQHILDEMQWDGPVFKTSGLMSEGTKPVVYYLMDQIEQQRERELEDPDYAAEVKAFREQLEAETREQTIAAKEAYREMRRQQRLAGLLADDEDDDEDDGEMEVFYVR